MPVPGTSEPDEVLDLDTIEAMLDATHPTRGMVLRRFKHPHTVAEVAAAMDVPVTRLYHHVNRLVDAGLIRVVSTRRVAAVTEHRYRVVARSFRLHDDLLASNDRVELGRALASVFDLAKIAFRQHIESTESGTAAHDDTVVALNALQLTGDQRSELGAELEELVRRYADMSADDTPGTSSSIVFVASFSEPE